VRAWSNGATYSPEHIQAAREHAAQAERDLIESIESGETKCRDGSAWCVELRNAIAAIESGASDNNFTIWQRMNAFLTGECPPLLPGGAA